MIQRELLQRRNYMLRLIAVAVISCISLMQASCAKETAQPTPQPPPRIITGHGGTVVVEHEKSNDRRNATAEVLKGMKLADYPSKTIGEAFEGYSHFTSREWSEVRTPQKKIYIDFFGLQRPPLFPLNNKTMRTYAQGVAVKFVINPDGKFYVAMVSRVDIMSDGKRYEKPFEGTKQVLDAIYADKKIEY